MKWGGKNVEVQPQHEVTTRTQVFQTAGLGILISSCGCLLVSFFLFFLFTILANSRVWFKISLQPGLELFQGINGFFCISKYTWRLIFLQTPFKIVSIQCSVFFFVRFRRFHCTTLHHPNKWKGFAYPLRTRPKKKDLIGVTGFFQFKDSGRVAKGQNRLCRSIQISTERWWLHKRSSLHLDTGHWIFAEHIAPQCQKPLSFLAGRSAFYKHLKTLFLSSWFMEGFALIYVGVAGSAKVTRHIWTETSAPAQLNSLHKVLRAWRIRLWPKSDYFQVSKCTRCVH